MLMMIIVIVLNRLWLLGFLLMMMMMTSVADMMQMLKLLLITVSLIMLLFWGKIILLMIKVVILMMILVSIMMLQLTMISMIIVLKYPSPLTLYVWSEYYYLHWEQTTDILVRIYNIVWEMASFGSLNLIICLGEIYPFTGFEYHILSKKCPKCALHFSEFI